MYLQYNIAFWLQYVNPSLGGRIMTFDPTGTEADAVPVENINKQLAGRNVLKIEMI